MSVVPSCPYVYALVDPRDNAVFYIGKGKGRRMYEHEREAARGDKYVTNPEKRAATINRAMALMGRLAAELAAPAKH